MKFAEVAENTKKLVACPPSQDEFIYELLLAYGTPKATIARLKSGQANLSKVPGEVFLKKKVFFKASTTEHTEDFSATKSTKKHEKGNGRLLAAIEAMNSAKAVKANDPRFLIVTDFARIYRSRPFTSDEERLEHLFKLYEEMVAREKLI